MKDRYGVNYKPAVKLVYRTSMVGGYWGVMQTSWTDAPIAGGWNSTRRVGNRELRLHFNGSKLAMVSFVENGALYWVTNTLLNDLSNETMIAIAKGLKPLSAVQ